MKKAVKSLSAVLYYFLSEHKFAACDQMYDVCVCVFCVVSCVLYLSFMFLGNC